VITARGVREQPDAVDGEERTSGGNQGEDERSRLMMPAQMEPDDQQRQQERCGQERLQIAVIEQEPRPQGREQPDQGRKPYTAQRGKKGCECRKRTPTTTHPE
jgi:hypothetical protein